MREVAHAYSRGLNLLQNLWLALKLDLLIGLNGARESELVSVHWWWPMIDNIGIGKHLTRIIYFKEDFGVLVCFNLELGQLHSWPILLLAELQAEVFQWLNWLYGWISRDKATWRNLGLNCLALVGVVVALCRRYYLFEAWTADVPHFLALWFQTMFERAQVLTNTILNNAEHYKFIITKFITVFVLEFKNWKEMSNSR